MQFHHHGYVSGDPRIKPAEGVGLNPPTELPEEVDVLIIGSGPAGMAAFAQLSAFPTVRTAMVEKRDGRLVIGQADGIQARSVETFQAFGFAERIIQEAYRITETAIWKPDSEDPTKITRVARTPDDETGISEFPHLIVNQARVLDYYAEVAANSPSRMKPFYGWEFITLEVEEGEEYPVVAKVRGSAFEQEGEERIIRAKYALGGDGARSRVRDAIGAQHIGGVSYHAWGVMDVMANTDFPDIRLKCIIQSSQGSILHIPREGGFLFRVYVDLGEVAEDDAGNVRKTPLDTIIRKANEILNPYILDVKNVAWWSVYEVGHRVTDRFDEIPVEEAGTRDPHVFIMGDACHTHSAKAGQGMNVSMQDAFNVGWKLGHVLTGLAPASLMATYTAERQQIAQDLINFDREWSTMMAAKPDSFESPDALEQFYVQTAEFPAGFMTEYPEGLLIGNAQHQDLAAGFPLGKRFKSVGVMRVCDSNPVHLGHLATADGRWRIYAFADKPGVGESSKLTEWAEWMASEDGFVKKLTPDGGDPDALFDVKVIYQQGYTEVDMTKAPDIFRPEVGPFGLTDNWKVFAADPATDIFDIREISRDGAIVVVRPDQYVAQVLPLDDREVLPEFFGKIYSA